MTSPRLFLSYAWTNPEYQARVRRLADLLREASVDVLFDGYELQPGADCFEYMERCVSDASVTKVLLVCNPEYRVKAEERRGGVGQEARLLTPAISEQQYQAFTGKFAVALFDGDAQSSVPCFVRSRIFIDCRDPYGTGPEQIIRWAFDQPLHRKPPLGKRPGFVDEASDGPIGSSMDQRATVRALRERTPNALVSAQKYLSKVAEDLVHLRTSGSEGDTTARIEGSRPIRGQLVELAEEVLRYDAAGIRVLHRALEEILCVVPPRGGTEFDAIRFLGWEFFLHCCRAAVDLEAFEAVCELLDRPFVVPARADFAEDPGRSWTEFGARLRSLRALTRRQDESAQGRFLLGRCDSASMVWRICQIDLLLWLRGLCSSQHWRAHATPLTPHDAVFDVFVRARSSAYFRQLGRLLGVSSPQALRVVLGKARRETPLWQNAWGFEPEALARLEELGTRP